jgi:hypothetical protein
MGNRFLMFRGQYFVSKRRDHIKEERKPHIAIQVNTDFGNAINILFLLMWHLFVPNTSRRRLCNPLWLFIANSYTGSVNPNPYINR